jgi:signal transduction histidine kinase
MSERARRIGAKIEISSGNGAGTEVDVILQKKLAYEKNRDAAP